MQSPSPYKPRSPRYGGMHPIVKEVAELVIQRLINQACNLEDYESAQVLTDNRDLREAITIFSKRIIDEDRHEEGSTLCSNQGFMSGVTGAVREMLKQQSDYHLRFLYEIHRDISELEMPTPQAVDKLARELGRELEFNLDSATISGIEALIKVTGRDWQTCESISSDEESWPHGEIEVFEKLAVTYVQSEGAARLIKRFLEYSMELASYEGPSPQYELQLSHFGEIKTVIGVSVPLALVCDPRFQEVLSSFSDQTHKAINSPEGHVAEYRQVFAQDFTGDEILVDADLRERECKMQVQISVDLSRLMGGLDETAIEYVRRYDPKRAVHVELYQIGFNSADLMADFHQLVNRIGSVVYGEDRSICKATGSAPSGFKEGLEFEAALVENVRFREFIRQNPDLNLLCGELVDDDRGTVGSRGIDRKPPVTLPAKNTICFHMFIDSLIEGLGAYCCEEFNSEELYLSLERQCNDLVVHELVDDVNILVISEDLNESRKFMKEAFKRFDLVPFLENIVNEYGYLKIDSEHLILKCAQYFSQRIEDVIGRLRYSE